MAKSHEQPLRQGGEVVGHQARSLIGGNQARLNCFDGQLGRDNDVEGHGNEGEW
jgi:hypothetical protein